MDYKKQYDAIIQRSKHRILEGYVEKHHAIPRCMGGSDDIENIAVLTAREHFVCHQLLVKMYPEHYGLVKAANMMCVGHSTGRVNNRLYEWLRIRLALANSEAQTGSRNSQHGTKWVINPNTNEVRKVALSEVDVFVASGWFIGRKYARCAICDQVIGSKYKYCDQHRKQVVVAQAKQNTKTLKPKLVEDDFVSAMRESKSIRQALLKLGVAAAGDNYERAKKWKLKHKL